jgi:hypothetical protein
MGCGASGPDPPRTAIVLLLLPCLRDVLQHGFFDPIVEKLVLSLKQLETQLQVRVPKFRSCGS